MQRRNYLLVILFVGVALWTGCRTSESEPAVAEGVSEAQGPSTENSEPIQIYLQRVLVGEAAYERALQINEYAKPASEGWQYVSFDLIIENTTIQPRYSPQRLTGALVDSGGFERGFRVSMSQGSNQEKITKWLFPGIRYRVGTYVNIPLNQSPDTVNVSFDGGPIKFRLDANSPDDALAIPFAEMPADIPLVSGGAAEFSRENEFRLVYSDFRFVENRFHEGLVSLHATLETENFGGFNLRAIENGPGFVGVDSEGGYYEVMDRIYGYDVPPGFTQEDDVLIFTMRRPNVDFDWIWVAFVNSNGSPIAQAQLHPTEIFPPPER